MSAGRIVGSVVANVTLNRPTLAKMAAKAGLVAQGEIAAAIRGNRVVAASVRISPSQADIGIDPGPVMVGGEKYRGIAEPRAQQIRLAVLAPNDAVEDKASSIRSRI